MPRCPRPRVRASATFALSLVLVLGAAAPAARAADAAADSAAVLARARVFRADAAAADASRMWPAFSAKMRSAMQDSAKFAAMLGGIAGQIGSLDSVLSEEVRPSPDGWSVLSNCRFSKAPGPLVMAISFDGTGALNGLSVRPAAAFQEAPSAFLDYRTKATLRLPFDGEWYVVWGGRTVAQNYHASNRTQRFAMDLLVRRDGRSHAGDGTKLEDYYCYGLPLVAPAACTVKVAVDTFPDQTPGESDRAHPAGNHVLLDLGTGEYALLAHLRPGSLRVKPGDVLKPGQPIARCGNSGNTSEPHLHVHLQNSAVPLQGDGLPAFFTDVLVDGQRTALTELTRGHTVAPAPAAGAAAAPKLPKLPKRVSR